MKKIICLLPAIAVRSVADHRSELTTQLLFGETARVMEEEKEWLHVSCDWDGYEGWVHSRQVHHLEDQEYQRLLELEKKVLLNMVLPVSPSGILVRGSTLYPSGTIPVAGSSDSEQKPLDERAGREQIVSWAMEYLGTPYLWGGRTPFGIDCSGLTQLVFKLSGVRLERDTGQQVLQGEPVHLLADALPGDLCFFDDEEGKIVHTGIIIPGEKILHASGKVRADLIDHHGIYDRTAERYTHTLRTIRRVVGS